MFSTGHQVHYKDNAGQLNELSSPLKRLSIQKRKTSTDRSTLFKQEMLEKFLMAIVCGSFRGLYIFKKDSTVLSATPQTFAQLQYNVTEQCIPLSPKNCKLESCWLQEKTAQDSSVRTAHDVQGQHQIHTKPGND